MISSDVGVIAAFKSRPQLYIFSGGYFILLAIAVYYFTKWYLKKMFGNYIIQLKSYLKELDGA